MDASSGKTRLPKTRRVPEAFSGRELTERSLKIIETIGRYRFLSSSKVIRLVGGNEDVTHRHLQQLFHLGLISRLKIPSAPANSAFIYFLENAALLRNVAHDARINAECLNFEEIRLNRDKYGGEHTTNPETKQVNNMLVKRGKELHGPDRMYLNSSSIVFVEPVGETSKVAQLVDEASKKQ